MEMVNKHVGLTYFYLLIYIALSSGVILYNKVIDQDLYTIIPFILNFLDPQGLTHELVCSCSCCAQWVLSVKYFNFPFPITLTMIHMGFSGVAAFFLVHVFKVRYPYTSPCK